MYLCTRSGNGIVSQGEGWAKKIKDLIQLGHSMAQKKSTSKKSRKTTHYPVVRSSYLDSIASNASVRSLDVPKVLSMLNRRLYRYGRVYPVSISLDIAAGSQIEVFALRDDWAVHQGIKMAYKEYLKNTSDERKKLGKHTARWEDFRVHDGITGLNNELLPVMRDGSFLGAGTILTAGQFERSTIVDASDVQKSFSWGVPSATQYGVLLEYNKTGNAQFDPAVVVNDAPYVNIDSEVNEQTHDDLQADGQAPPYDANGSNHLTPFVKVATLGTGPTGDQRLSTGFFNAPCGLVVLVGNNSDWSSRDIKFEVKKGDYKGVSGLSLLE